MKKKQIRTILNQEKAIEHLKLAKGDVTITCINAEISTSQFYKWLEVDEIFKKDVITVYRNLKSFTEAKIIKNRIDNDEPALWKLRSIMIKKINNML